MKLTFRFLSLAAVAAASSISLVAGEGHTNAFEWAGTFTLADDTHTWIAQKVGGSYVDPSMKLVGCSIVAPNEGSIEANEAAANTLLGGTTGCTPVQVGESFGPFSATCECFQLVFDQNADTSMFSMNTANLEHIVLFAEHVPTEFERDMHYLQDSTGTDIEPVVQEGGGHHDHSHGHGHGDEDKIDCACAADEYNFNIDCTATAAMIDALNILKSTGCGTDCSSDECQVNWYIVQAHHDYCDPQGLPEAVEDDFHDFDSICESCHIERGFVEGAPDCPEPNCDDTSGNDAYAFLVANGCSTGCSANSECRTNYLTLRTVHDSCEHDTLSADAEEGLHDFEESCADVVCNSADSNVDQTVCTDPAPPSSATVHKSGLSVVTMAFMALLA